MRALSVVVATGTPHGDRKSCLRALERQELPRDDFEIVETAMEDGDLGRAWNQGAARASGRALVFLRDDVIPSPGFLAHHLRLWESRPCDLVIGKTSLDARSNALLRYGDEPGIDNTLVNCCGCTLGIDRELLRDRGALATGLAWGTEAELAFRFLRAGSILAEIPEPIGVRRGPRRMTEAAAMFAAEGRGSVELYRRQPAMLPYLKLGSFSSASQSALRLRRTLLAMGGPVAPVAAFGASVTVALPTRGRDAWLRFLATYSYWSGVNAAMDDRETWRRLTRGPVILMYHAIGAPGEKAGCYIAPVEQFARQMRWLKVAGYRVIGLDELLRYRDEHRLPPARAVAITFDDGYLDNLTLALPVLQRFGFTATFFLVTGQLGRDNAWDRRGELAGRPLLSWEQARALRDAGMTIGGHTRHHPVLPELPSQEAAQEIDGSHLDITRELDVAPDVFAYPYGRLDSLTPDAVERAGYVGACCSRSGVNDPAVSSFLLRRVEVRGTDSFARFVAMVRRGRARRRRGAT